MNWTCTEPNCDFQTDEIEEARQHEAETEHIVSYSGEGDGYD